MSAPDWAVTIPSSQALLQLPATTAAPIDAPDPQYITMLCQALVAQIPFFGELLNMGQQAKGGMVGQLLAGAQTFANEMAQLSTLTDLPADITPQALYNDVATPIIGTLQTLFGQLATVTGNQALETFFNQFVTAWPTFPTTLQNDINNLWTTSASPLAQETLDTLLSFLTGTTVTGGVPSDLTPALNTFANRVLNLAQIPALTAAWAGTVDGSRLAGSITASLVSGALSGATLAASALTSGAIPAGVTLAGSQLSSAIAAANVPSLSAAWAGTVDGSKLAGSIAASLINGALSSATLAASALTSGAIPAGVTLPGTQLTGSVAAGLISGALSNASIAASALTAGLLPSGVTLPGGQLTGPGSIGVNLLAAGAIPAGVTLGAAALTAGALASGVTIAGTALSSAITNQNYIPALTNAWTNTIDGSLLTGEIANSLVTGVVQAADIGTAIENHVDAGVQAIYNNTGAGNSLATFYTALNSLTNFLGFTTTGSAPAKSVAGTLAGQATTKALQGGVDPTTDGPFDITQAMTGSTLPTVGVTQGNSLICFVTTPNGGVKQSIRWLGYGLTNITAFYVNVYQINATTGVSTPVYSSPNIVGSVGSGSTPVWNSLNLPTANYISTTQGNIYVLEIQVFGTGTYNVVGVANYLPTHPTAIPAKYGATRNTPVLYGTVAPGTTGAPLSFVHAFNGVDNTVIAAAVIASLTAVTAATATCGGTPMTLLKLTPNYATTGFDYTAVFGLRNSGGAPFAAGNQTIAFTLTGGTSVVIAASSASYPNVTALGTAQTNNAAGTALTHTVTGAAGSIIVNVLGTNAVPGSFSGYSNGEVLYQKAAASGVNLAILIGDTYGYAANVVLSATVSSGNWYSIAVPLTVSANPLAPTLPNPAIGPSIAYTNNTPWIGMASSPGATTYSPVLVPITASGTFDPTLYPWANFYDVILSGGGGSGRSGDNTFGGNGGGAASWNTETVTKAQAGTSPWTFTIGGGAPQISVGGGNGNAGNASAVSIPSYPSGNISAPGGAAGVGQSGRVQGNPGGSMPAGTWTDHYGNTHSVPGGAGGATSGQYGAQPGAGGAGGQAVYAGPAWPSGGGGNGIGYVYVYQ